MRINRAVSLLIAVALVALVSGAAGAKRAGFPRPAGYTGDFAGVIAPGYRQNIEALATELERKTSAEIAVVTVNNLDGMDIDSYAVDLFEEWGIGKRGKDNGLLVLFAMEEKKVRIEAGYGLEGIIPDGLAGDIIRQKMLPAFREGKYGLGLFSGAAVSAGLIAREAGVELSILSGIPAERLQVKKTGKGGILGKLLYLFILFMFFGGRMIFFPMMLGGGFWSGGRGGFGGGGGFGGFGGGLSGGGGASGSW